MSEEHIITVNQTMNMNICRTCLSRSDLKPIFFDENKQKRTEDLLSATGIKIEPNDGLSQVICKKCTTNINITLELRKQSVNAEKVLKILSQHLQKQPSHMKAKKNIFAKVKYKDNLIEADTESELNVNSCQEIFNESVNLKNTDNLESIKNKKYTEECENGKGKRRRRRLSQEQKHKYMSLAVLPYDKEGPVKCRLCHKQLRVVRYFIDHAKTHFEREHACESCDKKFVNASALRSHRQRLHGAEPGRGHVCATCGYSAADGGRLQNHVRAIHTGERPFLCDVCGDSFRLRAGIAQHMRTHFAAKCVQCEKCPAMFRSRSELALHRNKVHIMTYTYYCYLCPGKYKGVSTVKDHIVKAHGIPREQHLPIKCVKKKRE